MKPGQNMDSRPDVSIGRSLLEWFAVVVAIFGLFLLDVLVLDDMRFGFQFMCLIAQTAYVFFYVFCDTRYWHGYDLRNKAVQREIPRLLRIHCLFLIIVFAVVTGILSTRPYLPLWVFVETTGRRPMSVYSVGFFLICFAVVETQVVISRKILNRAIQ
jgi:hypothetical protein